jgi:hypothetical protein
MCLSTTLKIAALSILGFLACAALPDYAVAAGAPDVNLVTEYSSADGTGIQWIECGVLANGINGCFSSGTLHGLKKPCSITEGQEAVMNMNGQYITSTPVYVLDAGTKTGDQLTLDVYIETKNVRTNTVSTSFKLTSQVVLPVVAGPTATCAMSANNTALLAGTNVDPHAVKVTLSNLSVFQYGAFSPPINVTAITQNENGYISIQYGGGEDSGFLLIAPDGSTSEDGGGTPFLINPAETVAISSTGEPSGVRVAHTSFHPTRN